MDWPDALRALLIGVPAIVIGYLAYRRSRHVDAVSAQSGAAVETRAGTAQIIDGLNAFVDQLQEDNAGFRDAIHRLQQRLDVITKERDDLRFRIARLNRLYGENGDPPTDPPTVAT